ncbi:GNAT family N-acetyltransferase [Halomicroarcula sp. GCM10025709]|uniref:GNAT family N-acetyltransferase n=1 Tax=Haloarcula TaxID=2237 RepID=UPI0024C31C2D|nr:GNAT family N-acetyltransferase [Halomicroarcula sp. YJ-61-S]
MGVKEQKEGSDEYEVRWFQRDDRHGILSLYETEWDRRPTPDWFDWKYVDDPFLSHVPINVATHGGEIVGTQAYVPARIRRGDRSVLALQPADAMVHPDHRRKGLYTRITRSAIDRYEDGEPAFFFNFPNPGALSVQRDLGWSALDRVVTHYRVQRPAELLTPGDAGVGRRTLGRTMNAIARGALGVVGARRSSSDDSVEVDRYETVPAETLETLYETAPPRRFHVQRDSAFYRWWFADPAYEDTTYVASRDGEPVAAIVTRTRNGRKVKLMDALPAGPGEPAFGRLIATIVSDNADASVLAVSGSTLPSPLLSRFGFVPDEAPIVSRFRTPTEMAVRPLTSDSEADRLPVGELADGSNWRTTFTEQDRD